MAVKLLVGKTSVIICLHFSANRFLLRKVQCDLEKEIMKITVAGLFLKVLVYAPKL